jgi:hypothetical protein
MKAVKRQSLAIRLPEGDKAKLAELAEAEGRTLTSVVQRLVRSAHAATFEKSAQPGGPVPDHGLALSCPALIEEEEERTSRAPDADAIRGRLAALPGGEWRVAQADAYTVDLLDGRGLVARIRPCDLDDARFIVTYRDLAPGLLGDVPLSADAYWAFSSHAESQRLDQLVPDPPHVAAREPAVADFLASYPVDALALVALAFPRYGARVGEVLCDKADEAILLAALPFAATPDGYVSAATGEPLPDLIAGRRGVRLRNRDRTDLRRRNLTGGKRS